MKRIALVLSVLATLAFAGPVSANHEISKGYFAEPGIHGNVSVTTDYHPARARWRTSSTA